MLKTLRSSFEPSARFAHGDAEHSAPFSPTPVCVGSSAHPVDRVGVRTCSAQSVDVMSAMRRLRGFEHRYCRPSAPERGILTDANNGANVTEVEGQWSAGPTRFDPHTRTFQLAIDTLSLIWESSGTADTVTVCRRSR